jgi:hypothetical protein
MLSAVSSLAVSPWRNVDGEHLEMQAMKTGDVPSKYQDMMCINIYINIHIQ